VQARTTLLPKAVKREFALPTLATSWLGPITTESKHQRGASAPRTLPLTCPHPWPRACSCACFTRIILECRSSSVLLATTHAP
jgi:hypothetical protein